MKFLISSSIKLIFQIFHSLKRRDSHHAKSYSQHRRLNKIKSESWDKQRNTQKSTWRHISIWTRRYIISVIIVLRFKVLILKLIKSLKQIFLQVAVHKQVAIPTIQDKSFKSGAKNISQNFFTDSDTNAEYLLSIPKENILTI